MRAFTRLELLAVLATLALLGALALPAVTPTRESGHRVACANNLRQLGRALLMYADENEGQFAPRSGPPYWPQRLLRYYGDTNLLRCPSDPRSSAVPGNPPFPADAAPRSYIYNGWNDWFLQTLDATNWVAYLNHQYPGGIPESAINRPADTIAFGEKVPESFHFYLDVMQGIGNDLTEVEQGRHTPSGVPQDGGSNHAMADGSVQFLKYGAAFSPVVLWYVTDPWRNAGVNP